MKPLTVSVAAVATLVFGFSACDGFSASPAIQLSTSSSTTQLDAISRRCFLPVAVGVGSIPPVTEPAFAGEYEPQLKDMKQIYFLGASLDKLVQKLENPDQLELALSGVKSFNKNPNFYSGYAQNFIRKSVKYNADGDPRVGYIKQASTLIGSLENLLGGGDALMNEKNVGAEAIKRVQKAQSLISKFIEESGVQDEKLAAFVFSHK